MIGTLTQCCGIGKQRLCMIPAMMQCLVMKRDYVFQKTHTHHVAAGHRSHRLTIALRVSLPVVRD